MLYDENEKMTNNFRPVKPLNGRTIYRSYQELGLYHTSVAI